MRSVWWFPPVCCVATLAGCSGFSDEKAVRLVEAYNRRVAEAFRAADARLIEPVTGPNEGKKLTGLIGVKLDQGITLDAQLLDFKVLGIERRKGEVVVRTEERWYYQDRRVGTGERVGQDSTDHYFMRYHIRHPEGRWVVDEIAFDKAPEVGRSEVPAKGEARALHGAQAAEPGRVGSPPAAEPRDGGKQ